MSNIKIDKDNLNIKLYGSEKDINREKEIIENLELSGNERKDRLIIQKCIDDNKLKTHILYDGNTVYPFKKIINEYRKLQKSGSLVKLSKYMYDFFCNACGDIAHYNIDGFKSYYDYSLKNLENETLRHKTYSSLFTDRDKIFKELKICDYFDEREYIDINKISLKEMKSIIKELGWNVKDKNDGWELSKNMLYDKTFSFNIDISNSNISDIYDDIYFVGNHFNQDEYAENLYEDKKDTQLKLSEIVALSDYVKSSLYKFNSDLLYQCRILADQKGNEIGSIDEGLVM